MIKKRTLIILSIFLGIGIIHGFWVESLNTFFSWLLIGLWILYTIKYFQKTNSYKEFNSPHNTSFFILTPLLIGVFYSICTLFVDIVFITDNFFINTVIYLSWWNIIFSFPYIIIGLYSIYSCYRKFDIVYIVNRRSIKARNFAFSFSFFIFIIIIGFWIYIGAIVLLDLFILEQIRIVVDLLLILTLVFMGILFIIPGLVGSKRSPPEISPEYIARRRSRVETVSTTPVRVTPRRQPAKRAPTRTTVKRAPKSAPTRTTSNRSTAKRAPQRTTAKRAPKSRPSRQRTQSSVNFDKLKPKAGILSLEDFKCIFCFNLPQLPADQNRGIILCPNCRHPAHSDEFKDWTKSSNLCSRCDAPIPPVFFRNPKIITTKVYLEVIKEFNRRNR